MKTMSKFTPLLARTLLGILSVGSLLFAQPLQTSHSSFSITPVDNSTYDTYIYPTITQRIGRHSFQAHSYVTVSNAGYQLKIYSRQDPRAERFDNPVLVTEGFDPNDGTETRLTFDRFEEIFNEILDDNGNDVDEPGVLDQLYNEGYDIVLLRFMNPNASVYHNAEAVLDAIKWVQSRSIKIDGHELILIGPSMGGLVSRLALQTAGQRAGGPTYGDPDGVHVKLFIAWDSPNRGANVPLSSQGFLSIVSKVDEGTACSYTNLTSQAANQMLLETINMNNTDVQAEFFSTLNDPAFRQEIRNITNYGTGSECQVLPIRTIAVSNGSADGFHLNYPSNTKYASTEGRYLTGILKFDITMRTMEAGTNVNYFKGWVKKRTPFLWMLGLPGWIATALTMKEASADLCHTSSAFIENAPGGQNDVYFQIYDNSKKYFNWDFYDSRFFSSENGGHDCFIPTPSAAGIVEPYFNYNDNASFYRTWPRIIEGPMTMFDRAYLPSKNQEHVSGTIESKEWIMNEIRSSGQECFPGSNPIRYVRANIGDTDGTPGVPGQPGAGHMWTNAYKHLTDALDEARANPSIREIRVADGTYYTDRSFSSPAGSGNHYASFVLANGVILSGGYPADGGENRNTAPGNCNTILSGQINDDIEYPFSQYVITGDQGGTVDGFVIRDNHPTFSGAAISIDGGSLTVANCRFVGIGNSTNGVEYSREHLRITNSFFEGYNRGVSARFLTACHISDCRFTDQTYGVDIDIVSGNILITRTNFHSNGGSAVNINEANRTTISECKFIESNGSDCISIRFSPSEISRSIFFQNQGRGVITYEFASNNTINNCVFLNNNVLSSIIHTYIASETEVKNCTFVSNITSPEGSCIRPENATSTTVNNSIFYFNVKDFDNTDGVISVSHTLTTQSGYAGNNYNIHANPRFDAPNGRPVLPPQCKIKSDSPCRGENGAQTINPSEIDITGKRRTPPADMGAYEY